MSYKDSQEIARMKMKPRIVHADEWDDHDKLFMSKQALYNRKVRRQKIHDPKFTKKRFKRGKVER